MEEKKGKSAKPKTVQRKYKGQVEIDHDLFRLESAMTKKNVSFTQSPIWEPVEHKHMFHSVDSDGKPQSTSCPTASHYHKIMVEEVNGELVATCSKPYKMKVIKGKRVEVPYGNDEHTHEVTYLRSEKVMQRVFNADALKAISQIKAEEAQRMKNPAL